MSILTYRARVVRALLAVATIVLLAACGGTSDPGSSSSTSDPADTASSTSAVVAEGNWSCLKAVGATTRTLAARQLPVATLGGGVHAVVLSDESDEDVCSWLPLARELAHQGFRVAMYDYTGDPVRDLEAVAQAERAGGARTVVLMGASEGAKASIVAASRLRPRPDAVVSLSAESDLQGTAVSPYAAKLTMPTLFATAANDPYGADEATHRFYSAAPAKQKQLMVAKGTAHGTALLANGKIHRAVTGFLAAHGK